MRSNCLLCDQTKNIYSFIINSDLNIYICVSCLKIVNNIDRIREEAETIQHYKSYKGGQNGI